MLSAHIPLAKVFHVTNPKISELGTYVHPTAFPGKSQGHDGMKYYRKGVKSWDYSIFYTSLIELFLYGLVLGLFLM